MVARSVFERLEASGFRELKVHLTEKARAHALAAAVPEQFTASVVMVGARGFEPPTSSSRTMRAAKLRHAPTENAR